MNTGGTADEVRDTVLKVLVSKLSESSLAEKSDELVQEIFAKISKSKSALNKMSAKSPDDLAIVERAFAAGATTQDKKTLLKVWLRTLIPKKNYCWLASYPATYLQVMLRLVHPDYCDSWPTSGKELALLLIQEWFGSTYKKNKKRRAEDDVEEMVTPAKKQKVSTPKEAKPKVAKEPKVEEKKEVKAQKEVKKEEKKEVKKDAADKAESLEREDSLVVNTIDASMTAMKDPAPEVTNHLPSLDTPLQSGSPDMSLEEQKEAMSLIAAIKDAIMRGDSEVATIADLAMTMGVEQSQVKSAAKMMQKHDEVLYDESLGVVYAV